MTETTDTPPPSSLVEASSDLELTLHRSFEAVWYQAEVLHKRELDLMKEKFEVLEKQTKTAEINIQQLEEVIKERIMMFSQDIIATLKEMRAQDQQTMNNIAGLLNGLVFKMSPTNQLDNPEDGVEELVGEHYVV